MPELRCRQCKKRPIWRYKNNDIAACKRCYHQVWHATRQRLQAYRAALGLLERGHLPASLATYGQTVEEMARAVLAELQGTLWRTGAKHEVPQLVTRCVRLARANQPEEAPQGDVDAQG
jgi:hypothetical protein